MYTKEYLEGRLAVLMGGRAAEVLIFNRYTTGAGNDIERATDIARNMVCSWGMSEKLGPLAFGKKDEAIFLGKELSTHKNFSEKTAVMIDEEVKGIVTNSYRRALNILEEHTELLHAVSKLLLEKETIDGKEIDELIEQLEKKDELKEENVAAEN
jgi:cell division protease FtsH